MSQMRKSRHTQVFLLPEICQSARRLSKSVPRPSFNEPANRTGVEGGGRRATGEGGAEGGRVERDPPVIPLKSARYRAGNSAARVLGRNLNGAAATRLLCPSIFFFLSFFLFFSFFAFLPSFSFSLLLQSHPLPAARCS